MISAGWSIFRIRIEGLRIWKFLTAVRLIGVGLLALAAWLTYRRYGFDWTHIGDAYFNNLVTDLFSLVFAVLVIDALNDRRANRERKRAIIEQMGSPVLDAALEAVRIATKEGWLQDGSLRSATLSSANLPEASPDDANLQGANLTEAKFNKDTVLPDATPWTSGTDMTRFTDPNHPDFYRLPADEGGDDASREGPG